MIIDVHYQGTQLFKIHCQYDLQFVIMQYQYYGDSLDRSEF